VQDECGECKFKCKHTFVPLAIRNSCGLVGLDSTHDTPPAEFNSPSLSLISAEFKGEMREYLSKRFPIRVLSSYFWLERGLGRNRELLKIAHGVV
jgi:hypothetical protein